MFGSVLKYTLTSSNLMFDGCAIGGIADKISMRIKRTEKKGRRQKNKLLSFVSGLNWFFYFN